MSGMARLLASLALLITAAALTASPALARDRDNDGLSNLREYRAHTNPRKKDSDRDKLKDGAELRLGFDPRDRDSDDDGIKDGRENAGRITRLSGSAITIR